VPGFEQLFLAHQAQNVHFGTESAALLLSFLKTGNARVTDGLSSCVRRFSFGPLCLAALLAMTPAMAQARNLSESLGVAETSSGNFLAALAADAKRDTAAAAHFFREALREDPRNAELQERAFIASVQDGSMNDAFRLAERVLKRDPENALAHLTLGTRALKNRQFITARNHFLKAGGRGRNADISAALLVAWSHVGSGDLKKALETIDRFTDPQFVIYRNFYGGLMANLAGDRKEAAKRLKAAYETEGTPIRLADAYARFEARHGSRETAKAIYDKLAHRPSQIPFIAQARKVFDEGGVPEPLVQNVAQGAAEVLFTASDTGNRRGGEIVAVIYLQLANHLVDNNDMVLVSLAESFEALKQYDRSIDLYTRVPADSGIKIRSTLRAAVAYNEMKKTDEALKILDEQILKQPKDVSLYETLAAIQRGNKKWAEAASASSKAIDLVSRDDKAYWSLFYGRGIAYERNKQWPLAEADLKHALTLLPEEPQTEGDRSGRAHVLNHLAYSWVDMGLNIDESFVMLKRAVELQPRDGYIIDSLGWAYYRLAKYEDAVRELERAVDIKAADPVLNDHLGDAYWKAGRTDEARFQWNHARDLKPEPEDLEKILKKIEKGMDDAKAADTEAPKRPNGG
jgi:tetratricopeptide (TPR) repeat protein